MARPKLGESETERLHLKITADEISAIDDWRFANRVPSRSEAVRRLCQIALLIEPLIGELKLLWEANQTAGTALHEALIDAHADPNKRSASEVVKLFDKPITELLPATLNLGIHAWTMEEVLDRLKSGTDLVGSIEDLKREISVSERARNSIQNLATEPVEIHDFSSPKSGGAS